MLDLASNLWILRFISYFFRFYEFCIIAYVLSSWFPSFRNNIIVEFLEAICEPYLKLFRKIIPPIGMMDISPIVAVMGISLIQQLVVKILFGI